MVESITVVMLNVLSLGSAAIHLSASVGSIVEAVYSEVARGQEDDSRLSPAPYELPATTVKTPADAVGDGENGLVLLEEEQFIRTASGLTIASRTTINPPKLSQSLVGAFVRND